MMMNSEIVGSAILSVIGDWRETAINDETLLEILDYLVPLRHEELLTELGEEDAF